MSVENFEEKEPIPAIVDAETGPPIEFEAFEDQYHAIKYTQAKQAAKALCLLHECSSLDELVSRPDPHEGPKAFLENSELFSFHPNFEELVVMAVQTNNAAAKLFINWFAQFQFIKMEFYEAVLEVALETEMEKNLKEANLPDDFEQAKASLEEKNIKCLKFIEVVKRIVSTPKDMNQLRQLPKSVRLAVLMSPKRLMSGLKMLNIYNETLLKELEKIFAK